MKLDTDHSGRKLEYPCLFIFGFGLLTVYVPGITGAAIPSGWLWLILITPIALLFYKANLKIEHKIGFVFIVCSTLSLAWTTRFNIGLFYCLQVISLGIVFYIGSALKDLRPIVMGLAAGLGINTLIGITQYFGSTAVFVDGAGGFVAGLFVNKNIFCEVSVSILISLMVYKLWWFIPVTIPGIVLSPSRAGLLALGVCGYIYFYSRFRYLALLFAITFSGSLALYFYYTNTFSFTSIDQRFQIWADTLRGLTLFGGGVGSFETLFPKYSIYINTILERLKYAHNDLLQLIFEYGIFSIILLPFFWNILKLKCKENYILYAILIISMFTYPFHNPATAFLWFIVAGYVIGNNDTFQSFGFCRRLELLARHKDTGAKVF